MGVSILSDLFRRMLTVIEHII